MENAAGLDPAETDFCREYRLGCLEQLSRWNEIFRLKPNEDPWKARTILRRFISNAFRKDTSINDLNKLSPSSCLPSVLPDLAAYAIFLKEDRAKLCVKRATEDFLAQYCSLSLLNFGRRRSLLQRVCTITEVQSALDQPDYGSQWTTQPQTDDNLVVWDSILNLRTLCSQLGDDQKRSRLFEQLNVLRLQVAGAALSQRNVGLAKSMMDASVNTLQSSEALQQLVQIRILIAEPTDDAGIKLDQLCRAKESLNQLNMSGDSSSGKMGVVTPLCALLTINRDDIFAF